MGRFAGWSAAKYRLDARRNVQDRRLHDCVGPSPPGCTLGGDATRCRAVLNHSQAGLFGVTAIYLRDRQEGAKREALEPWSQRLRSFVDEGSER